MSTGGPASGGTVPARILEGTVVSVDVKNYRVNVAYAHTTGTVEDVRVTSMYCHPHSGEGGHVLPDPGASCMVGFPSEPNGRPFLLGYVMPPTSKTGDLGGRAEQASGEFVFRTRDGNCIALRRGGVVQITSTPLCQTLYVPVGNMIRSIFQRAELLSLLGKLEWVHDDVGATGSVAHFRLELKDTVELPLPKVVLEFSSTRPDLMPLGYVNLQGDTPDPFLPAQSQVRLHLYDPTGLLPLLSLQLSPDGSLHQHSTGYTLLRSDGVFRISALGGFDTEGLGWSSRINAVGLRREEFAGSTTNCAGAYVVQAGNIVLAGDVALGGAGAPYSVCRADAVEVWSTGVSAALGIAPLTGARSPVRTT